MSSTCAVFRCENEATSRLGFIAEFATEPGVKRFVDAEVCVEHSVRNGPSIDPEYADRERAGGVVSGTSEMRHQAEALGFECQQYNGALYCEIRNGEQRKGVGIAGDPEALSRLYVNDWDAELRRAMRSVGLEAERVAA